MWNVSPLLSWHLFAAHFALSSRSRLIYIRSNAPRRADLETGPEKRQIKAMKRRKKRRLERQRQRRLAPCTLSGFSPPLSLFRPSLTFFFYSLLSPKPGPRRPQRPARQGPQDHRRHPHPRRDPHPQVPRRQRRQGAADVPPGPPQGRPRGQVPPQPGRAAPAGAAQGHQGLQGRRLHRGQGRCRGQGPRQRCVVLSFEPRGPSLP